MRQEAELAGMAELQEGVLTKGDTWAELQQSLQRQHQQPGHHPLHRQQQQQGMRGQQQGGEDELHMGIKQQLLSSSQQQQQLTSPHRSNPGECMQPRPAPPRRPRGTFSADGAGDGSGVRVLCASLRARRVGVGASGGCAPLKTLRLRGHAVTVAASEALAGWLRGEGCCLQVLDLGNCGLRDEQLAVSGVGADVPAGVLGGDDKGVRGG